jgi:hypothetical protein
MVVKVDHAKQNESGTLYGEGSFIQREVERGGWFEYR